MEAAIVLPIIILVTITSILIIMFFFYQMTERCRLHVALRYEAGMLMEESSDIDGSDMMGTDAEIYYDKKLINSRVYGKKYLIMNHKGVLDKKGTFIVEGSCYATDGARYVRNRE